MSADRLTLAVAFSLSSFVGCLNASDQTALLNRIGAVESNNRAHAVGDLGLALGFLQIHAGVVKDVNRLLGTTYTHEDMLKPALASSVFRLYLGIYATPARLGRPVTDQDRALIWHSGPDGWKTPTSARALRYLSKFNPPLK